MLWKIQEDISVTVTKLRQAQCSTPYGKLPICIKVHTFASIFPTCFFELSSKKQVIIVLKDIVLLRFLLFLHKS